MPCSLHPQWLHDAADCPLCQHFRLLASAMRKVLPAPLLQEVIDHLDPLTPFVTYLKAGEDR